MLQFLRKSGHCTLLPIKYELSRALEILHRRWCERAAPVGEAVQARIFLEPVLLQVLPFNERYAETPRDWRRLEARQQTQSCWPTTNTDNIVDFWYRYMCGARGKPPVWPQLDTEGGAGG
jgi:hypothetical protein